MTIPVFEPDPGFYTGCMWPINPSECDMTDWDTLDEAVQVRSLHLASNALHRLTAGRVTNCPVTIRPCSPGGCSCRYGCLSCTSGCEIQLPIVGKVLEVKVDGTALPLSDFRVDSNRIIVWQGEGDCPFLHPQNLKHRDDEPGTWSITYLPGYPVDSAGATAVTALALEFAKACEGDDSCALPRGVTAVVRFGMTFDVDDSLFPNGETGIELVDAFIHQWNPQRRTQRTQVFSPDVPEHRVQG